MPKSRGAHLPMCQAVKANALLLAAVPTVLSRCSGIASQDMHLKPLPLKQGCSGSASSRHCPGWMACPLQTTRWRVSRPLSCHVPNPCCPTHDIFM